MLLFPDLPGDQSIEDVKAAFSALPTPALPGSGSKSMISALVLRHPYWIDIQIYEIWDYGLIFVVI